MKTCASVHGPVKSPRGSCSGNAAFCRASGFSSGSTKRYSAKSNTVNSDSIDPFNGIFQLTYVLSQTAFGALFLFFSSILKFKLFSLTCMVSGFGFKDLLL